MNVTTSSERERASIEVKSVRPARATDGGTSRVSGALVLEDGTRMEGWSFGAPVSTSGEVVFCTGMVGYPESLTDPSYCGQILVSTFPLVGNYGVPHEREENGLERALESDRVHVRALLVQDYSTSYSHWEARRSLGDWLHEEGIPGLSGIDTRSLTKRLRERGSMLGKIVIGEEPRDFYDPNIESLGAMVSVSEPETYGTGTKEVVLFDCGAKHNIIHSLLQRGLKVRRVPWDYDMSGEAVDGVMISNGPGNPRFYQKTIAQIRGAMERRVPIFGICLGHQLLSLAAGASAYKLKYGHRGQNQPVIEEGTHRCSLTSQNHGFAVDPKTLSDEWSPWFTNLNDGTNEGLRHESGRFRSVQFHPEAAPGPTDTSYLFDEFAQTVGA